MNITPIPAVIYPDTAAAGGSERARESGTSFRQVLNQAIETVNNSQVKADEATSQFLTGEIQDLHQVTIALEEAKVMMQLAIEVRNKIVEAYQEISRMQV